MVRVRVKVRLVLRVRVSVSIRIMVKIRIRCLECFPLLSARALTVLQVNRASNALTVLQASLVPCCALTVRQPCVK